MSYTPGCIISDFYCNQCTDIESGRIRAVAFVLRGAPLANPSAESDWTDLVCNKLAYVMPEVRGTYDGGADVEGAGYGAQASQITGMNHSATYMQQWDALNNAFYNDLRYSRNWEFWFATENYVHHSVNTVLASAKLPITEDLASKLEFNVTVKWAYKNIPTAYARPTKVFDSCEGLAAAIDCNAPCPTITLFPC